MVGCASKDLATAQGLLRHPLGIMMRLFPCNPTYCPALQYSETGVYAVNIFVPYRARTSKLLQHLEDRYCAGQSTAALTSLRHSIPQDSPQMNAEIAEFSGLQIIAKYALPVQAMISLRSTSMKFTMHRTPH